MVTEIMLGVLMVLAIVNIVLLETKHTTNKISNKYNKHIGEDKEYSTAVFQTRGFNSRKTDNDVTVGIPCVAYHLGYLHYTLTSVACQTVLPKKVIVSVSSFPKDKEFPTEFFYTNFPDLELKFIVTEEKQWASKNRNIIMDHCETEFLLMMDADDHMHPRRVEIIGKLFRDNPDKVLILHAWNKAQNIKFKSSTKDPIEFISYTRTEEDAFNVHEGHPNMRLPAFVDKNMYYKEDYDKRTLPEDLDFNRRSFKTFGDKVAIVNVSLTTYQYLNAPNELTVAFE